ncbi:hypothetical protein RDI58_024915 [Solanum bulbocastanum]|uniref:DUF4283 domain-containing protein n=1 Tax=Solanum bulbocastanum TaxID=147425 RepID=A0AAN8Y3W2_SOLBU
MTETKTTHITARNNKISVIGGSTRTESDLLSRCLVGKFQMSPNETPTLSDVRKWACNSWKSTFGVNVFSMNHSQYLFELFLTRKAAEHVMTGEWTWQKKKLNLQWWNPTVTIMVDSLQQKRRQL